MSASTAITAPYDAGDDTDEFQALRLFVPPVSIPERVHDDQHVLLWQVRGSGTDLGLDGAATFLPLGHAVWVPADVRHAFTVRANSVLLPLFFDRDDVATTLRSPVLVAVDRELRTLFLTHLQATTSIIQPQVAVTRQLLAHLLRSGASLPAVARRVGYTNLNAFRRAFKDRFSLTPTAYVERFGTRR